MLSVHSLLRRRALRVSCAWLGLALVAHGCAAPPDDDSSGLSVVSVSGAPFEDSSPTPRIRMQGVEALEPADFWLIEETIGSTTQSRLRSGEVPSSLEKRRRGLSVWMEEDATVAAAAEVLEPGRYSLVARYAGTLAELTVTEEAPDVLRRMGPKVLEPQGEAVYCALPSELSQLDEGPTTAAPQDWSPRKNLPIGVDPGMAEGWLVDHCLRVALRDEWLHDGVFVPPLLAGGRLLEPTPVPVARSSSTSGKPGASGSARESSPLPSTGAPTESTHTLHDEECWPLWGAPICLDGAKLEWRVGAAGLVEGAVTLSDGHGRQALHVAPEGEDVLRLGPLPPQSRVELQVGAFLAEGDRVQLALASLSLETGPARAHFVLTEVMADPDGPEPESEWVEILNAGTDSGSLGGLWIADEGGAVPLPDVTLAPDQFGLIVREDFIVDRALVPPAETVRVPVETIGGNGLRNSGERVELRDSQMRVVSAVPAGATAASTSWARSSPWASDAASSFGSHAEPGASPGASNEF